MKTLLHLKIILVFFVLFEGCGLWDGFFYPAEYQIKFIMTDGTPIKNIQLEVLNSKGKESPDYPVTDYHSKNIPTSDSSGLIIFHHVTEGFEFGGMFILFITKPSVPKYKCNFLLFEKNIYSIYYHELDFDLQDRMYNNKGKKDSVKDCKSKIILNNGKIQEFDFLIYTEVIKIDSLDL